MTNQQSRVLNDLCNLISGILRSPPSSSPQTNPLPMITSKKISVAEFASLLLGVSLVLMLCGSVTFVIGFILMPWVIGLIMFVYMVGLVSTISELGRTILFPQSRKQMTLWNFL